MHQVKIFKGLESDLPALEALVNEFLREANARVVQLSGNIAPQSEARRQSQVGEAFVPSDVLIVLVYEAASA